MIGKLVIAIVGRPNVGKSTLFNRLTETRLSVTSPVSGVTRDRIIAQADWKDKTFTLVDTGGIKFVNANSIEIETLNQSKLAIEEADLILFMVDGREQVHPLDKDIGLLLKKQNKPVVLGVNKIDNYSSLNWTDYYELGFEFLIPFSAEHNTNITELLDKLIEFVKEEEPKDEFEGIKLAIVGKPNAGKSLLVNSLTGMDRTIVSEIPGTTRDSVDTTVKYNKKEYMLTDTAGMRKRGKIYDEIEKYSVIRTVRSIERSDIAVLMLDATDLITNQDLKIADLILRNRKGIIIAVNKWDLIEKNTKTVEEFNEMIDYKAPFLSFAPRIFISSKTKQRIIKIFNIADEVYSELNKRIKTTLLNDFLMEIKNRLRPKSKGNKKIKINYMTQVGVAPPQFALFVNYPNELKESYKKYIINNIRVKYGFIGSPVILKIKKKNKK